MHAASYEAIWRLELFGIGTDIRMKVSICGVEVTESRDGQTLFVFRPCAPVAVSPQATSAISVISPTVQTTHEHPEEGIEDVMSKRSHDSIASSSHAALADRRASLEADGDGSQDEAESSSLKKPRSFMATLVRSLMKYSERKANK